MPLSKRFSKLSPFALCLALTLAYGVITPAWAQETEAAESAVNSVAESSAESHTESQPESDEAGEAEHSSDAVAEEVSDAEQTPVAAEVDSIPDESELVDDEPESEVSQPVRELSVRPGLGQLLPEDSPEWISAAPDYESKNHTLTVASLPVANRVDLERTLDEPLMAAFHNYIDEVVLNETDAYRRIESKVDAQYIRKNLIDDPAGYVAELSPSTGLMYQKWVRLVVSPAQREQITRWNREAIQRDRIAPLTAGIVAGLVLIGGLHLGLRRKSVGSTAARMAPEVIVDGSRYVSVPPKTRKKGVGAIVSALIALGGFAFIGFVLLATLLVGREATYVEGQNRVYTVSPTLVDGAERPNWSAEDLRHGEGEVTIKANGRSITIRKKD